MRQPGVRDFLSDTRFLRLGSSSAMSDMLAGMRKWSLIAIGLGLAAWIAFKPVPKTKPEIVPEAASRVAVVAGTPVADPVPRASAAPRSPSPLSEVQGSEVRNPEPPTAPAPQEELPPGPQVVGTVLRDNQGALLKSTQKEAARACSERGMHLPSIRELARLGKFRGAKGIMNVSQFRREDEADGYVLIKSTSPNGVQDFFYYSPKGYVRAAGETSETVFWSSSICVGCVIGGNEEPHKGSSHSFYGNGEIHDHYDDLNFAVRCVGPQGR